MKEIKSFIQVFDIYEVWKCDGKFISYPVLFAGLTDDDGDPCVSFLDSIVGNRDSQYFVDNIKKSENFCGYFHKSELEGVDLIEIKKFNPKEFLEDK